MGFLSKVWKSGKSALWSRLGLWLGYAAVGVAIALGCAAVWFYHQNDELHSSVSALNATLAERAGVIAQLEHSNAQQDKAIEELARIRKTDSVVVSGLLADYKRINAMTADTKTKLRELEKHNAEVRAYLSTPLPDAVRRVLNDEPASDGDGSEDNHRNPASGADKPVRRAADNDG